MAKSFWLGIIGGIFGIIGGILAIMIGGIGGAFDISGSFTVFGLGLIAILISIIGMAAGALSDQKIGGGILLSAAIGIFIAISLAGVLPAILFLIGGLIKYIQND